MKLKSILAITALATLTLGSCKKDYTCYCTGTAYGMSATNSKTIHDTKDAAKASCETGTASANGASVVCEIK
jgi:hypothetical protein